jgi:hypothetical protein
MRLDHRGSTSFVQPAKRGSRLHRQLDCGVSSSVN